MCRQQLESRRIILRGKREEDKNIRKREEIKSIYKYIFKTLEYLAYFLKTFVLYLIYLNITNVV